jgi:uncharacterized membrane protein YcjF (UPF0283 family)
MIRSRLHHAMLWLIAITLIMTGVYLSRIQYLGHEWLTRAGCLIVILGIWSSLGVILRERMIRARINRHRRNALIEARARLSENDKTDQEIEKEIESTNDAFDKELEDLTHKMKLSLGFMEVSLLMTGTFLWGFGDLFV